MIIKADLHNHLRTSHNMQGLLVPTLRTAKRNLGAEGIVGIVNFSNFGNNCRYNQLLEQSKESFHTLDLDRAFHIPEYNLTLIKGQEVPTKQGHLLVIGIPKNSHLEDDKDLDYSLKQARDLDTVIIADHPFSHGGLGNYLLQNPKLLHCFDGWEIHNGESAIFPRANENAGLAYYDGTPLSHYGVGAVSSSDGHSISEIGRSSTNLALDPQETRISGNYLIANLRQAVKKATPHDCIKTDSKLGALWHIANLKLPIKPENVLRI